MTITEYGYVAKGKAEHGNMLIARVTATHKERYEIICDEGKSHASLKAGEYYCPCKEAVYPTTGDFVLIDWNASGDSRITETLPRRTVFLRLDPSSSGHGNQAVAANFDYVFILQSLNHDFNARRLERYLTLAWNSGATPVVILTKSDEANNIDEMLSEARNIAAGCDVFAISSKTGDGLILLEKYLTAGKTIVFLGSSGVGKSSLVNALANAEVMLTGEIRENDSRGRHTTTTRQLIMLPCGAMVIDTPGMRELGMWDVNGGIDRAFADVEQFVGRCRFADCTHTKEPGCALLLAIERGELQQERLDAYRKLINESAFADNKTDYLAKKREKFKSIARSNKTKY